MNFIEWKWTCGEKMEKTPRTPQKIMKKGEYYEEDPYSYQQQQQETSTAHERTAYEQSLLSENDIWSIDGSVFIDKPLNKREDNYNKMSEREMFGQINQNPFLVQNNYLDDLMNQEKFLKPMSTSTEKEKNSSNANYEP
jgi:hypothetical protein|uniref:Uncharacterized protein n=1 Tax=viral metagenome TaxID=1070528 RepID=A0A6C0DDN8_9ZZZZ